MFPPDVQQKCFQYLTRWIRLRIWNAKLDQFAKFNIISIKFLAEGTAKVNVRKTLYFLNFSPSGVQQ